MRFKALSLATAAAIATVAVPAVAGPTISGSATGSGYTGSNGLIINVTGLSFGPITSLVNVGDWVDVAVLTVGTPEGSVNVFEDTNPRSISATFSFTNPNDAAGSPITGTSFGYVAPFTSCGIIAGGCGAVTWGAAQVFNYGPGGSGSFSVDLSDVTFGTPGSATVNARFTLLSNAVPEPATWALMILGFGAIGATMRSARRQTARIRFA